MINQRLLVCVVFGTSGSCQLILFNFFKKIIYINMFLRCSYCAEIVCKISFLLLFITKLFLLAKVLIDALLLLTCIVINK
mgnify:FL=1